MGCSSCTCLYCMPVLRHGVLIVDGAHTENFAWRNGVLGERAQCTSAEYCGYGVLSIPVYALNMWCPLSIVSALVKVGGCVWCAHGTIAVGVQRVLCMECVALPGIHGALVCRVACAWNAWFCMEYVPRGCMGHFVPQGCMEWECVPRACMDHGVPRACMGHSGHGVSYVLQNASVSLLPGCTMCRPILTLTLTSKLFIMYSALNNFASLPNPNLESDPDADPCHMVSCMGYSLHAHSYTLHTMAHSHTLHTMARSPILISRVSTASGWLRPRHR